MSKCARMSVVMPAGWPKQVRSAIVHAMSLASATLSATRGWAASQVSSRVRLRSEIERLRQEVALIQEEVRLKDVRMARVPGHERPHFPPIERLALLELRAVRGWSARQTADRFQLSPATVCQWMRRLDENGPGAIVQTPVPANQFPEFVAHIVQRLKLLCPSLGYAKIAHFLCRAGLHLNKSTVRRMIRRDTPPKPERPLREAPVKRVVARYPNHVWHCDLTTVPTSSGNWTSAFPFSLPQRWPFCWWLLVLADQYSCRILRLAVFRKPPAREDIQAELARAIHESRVTPKYLITDEGPHFRRGFHRWCQRRGIEHLFGALGQLGSIPFVERLIKTVKSECTRRILFPYSAFGARKELALFQAWYNGFRPHWRLRGATPDEAHDLVQPMNERVRFEPRGRRGDRLALDVRYFEGRKHLPIVALRRVA